jgi:eukaryotic-like serine/threonine-protein kinase
MPEAAGMATQIWQAGDRIKGDRFEILRQLGKGGFGIIYLAQDNQRQQQVVLKTLNADRQGVEDFAKTQEKFTNEGMTLKAFDNQHIVQVHELIMVGSRCGLVMEYVDGQNNYPHCT